MRPHPQTSDQTPAESVGNRCRPPARARFPYLKILHVGGTCVKWIPPLNINNLKKCWTWGKMAGIMLGCGEIQLVSYNYSEDRSDEKWM